jgi:hypothetical protein
VRLLVLLHKGPTACLLRRGQLIPELLDPLLILVLGLVLGVAFSFHLAVDVVLELLLLLPLPVQPLALETELLVQVLPLRERHLRTWL